MSKLDETLRPQDDFFGYVNNNWIKDNPIPADKSRWGTFDVLIDKSSDTIKSIVDEILKTSDNKLDHNQKLIKTYFSAALSYNKNQDNHLKTLGTELQKIHDIKNSDQLAYYLGHANRYSFSPLWNDYDSVDDKNSSIKVLCICQGGLSLPNKDYYLKNTSRMKNIRLKYAEYFKTVHDILPAYSPSNWDAVWDIELELAKASWDDVKLRDIEKNYTRFTINELQTRFSKFNWSEYFAGLAWKNPSDNIVVNQPPFIDKALDIINNQPLNEVKEYLSWHVTNSLLSLIDEKMTEISFGFYGKILSGKTQNSPLWKRAVEKADKLIIGEILGKEYVARYFPGSFKKALLELVEDIRLAYHKRIDAVTWMTDNTKELAHKKLNNTKVLIGYPPTWHNFDKLEFSGDNHIANILAANSFSSDIDIASIGKKPNPEKWYMNAHEVNACYDPNRLTICFPAGILQPPFYDYNASYATNIGAIGAVIGHELTHGFDDQGSQFDEYGNVRPWQTNTEKNNFKKLSQTIIDQANNFEIIPGTFLKGKLVIGEAIADIGGLELAVEALKLKTNSKDINRMLNELFISAATYEGSSQREEFSIEQAATDPHPPSKFRINCAVNHVDAFYDVYNVKPKDKLYLPPEQRAHIW